MTLFQAPVPHLPLGFNLDGKTCIVTGATAGIGLEICRQLLTYKLSNLVMAVRNVAKGEAIRKALLSDSVINSNNPNAVVKVIQLDAENYSSVQQFASKFKKEFQELHLLVANAGIGTHEKEFASSGHEKDMQVNYLSNVLLTLLLLPTLEKTADMTGEPARVTWTGSRVHKQTTFAAISPLGGQGILKHIDDANAPMLGRYANSKFLCAVFLLELAEHYSPKKVIINNFCPGLVDTGMTDELPFHLRMFMNVMKAIRARPVEKAGWIALNAALVAGADTHGRFLEDMNLDEPFDFIQSREGQQIQKMVWKETTNEMREMVELPSWM